MHSRATVTAALLFIAAAASQAQAVSLQGPALVGRHIYKDVDISYNATQSCATCHHQTSGFADPTNSKDPTNTFVSLGADGISKGGRNAPSAAYAGFSPILHRVGDEWFGGMFWDGRMTGSVLKDPISGAALNDPLAEQAQGPPLNPVEMKMPSVEAIIQAIRDSDYAHVFRRVFGQKSLDNTEIAWTYFAIAVAAYERSLEVTRFTSPYDGGTLTTQEQNGQTVFAKNCAACHSLDIPPGAPAPVFTSYGYANIGVPINQKLLDNDDSEYAPPDLGLGKTLSDLGYPDAALQNGKFKIPTLRNVARTAPYTHNGVFATLEEVIAHHIQRTSEPEVDANISPLLAEMEATAADIPDLVAFLKTLTDH